MAGNAGMDEAIERLIKTPLKTLSDEAALDCVGTLIDLAGDVQSSPGLTRAFGMLKEIGRRDLAPAQHAIIHYFRANALNGRRLLKGERTARSWEQPDRETQILSLFEARNHEGFAALGGVFRCKILTNLGIQLNEVGRFVDALSIWNEALAIEPHFAMAHGSRGLGLRAYAQASEDLYDREILVLMAHKAFTAVKADGAVWDSEYPASVGEYFVRCARHIAERYDLVAIEADLDLDSPALGRSKEEQRYRQWCLEHRLFVNPLNDLGPHKVAASDELMLPSITVGFETEGMPATIGLYNQMKQEC